MYILELSLTELMILREAIDEYLASKNDIDVSVLLKKKIVRLVEEYYSRK